MTSVNRKGRVRASRFETAQVRVHAAQGESPRARAPSLEGEPALSLSWGVMALGSVGRLLLHGFIGLLTLASLGGSARAEKLPLGFRTSFHGAIMVSKDQLLRLGYDNYGGLVDVHITYQPLRWVDLALGMVGGLFPASHGYPPGGLVAPLAGVLLHMPSQRLSPFLRTELGPGFTGDYVRTTIRLSAGVDIGIRRGVMMGPVFGFTQIFQKSGPYYSEDAKFVWFGLGLSYRPAPPPPPRPIYVTKVQEVHEHHHTTQTTTTVVNEVQVNDGELFELIENAIPSASERVELLAPVLFSSDSDALEPLGVAMLHEVARMLEERPELTRVAIEGYADRADKRNKRSLPSPGAT